MSTSADDRAPGPKLRGNYAQADATCCVQQRWEQYTDEDHDIWRTLYARQIDLVARLGAPQVLAGLEALGASPDEIPRFDAVNRHLQLATGWQIVAVPGLIPETQFYAHLAARRFPVSVWIRERHELDYLVEPDLFHDFFGHVPLLADQVFARFMEAYGAAGPKAAAHESVPLLARLYWYTVEFGLIDTPLGMRAYGAGILSSRTETRYSVSSPVPNRFRFDLARIMRTAYRIDELQRCYFVLDSFEQLFHAGYDTDFAPLYEALRRLPPLAPETVLPTDRVITRGEVSAGA